MKFALGQAVPRTEDPRLLTSRGRYTDDFVLPRLAHAYVLRSPHAHAGIRSVDIRAAQQTPGVLAVLTGEDWAAEKFGAPRPTIRRRGDTAGGQLRPARPGSSSRLRFIGVKGPLPPCLGPRQLGQLSAESGHPSNYDLTDAKVTSYSMTSSARARIEGGTVRPSAFAVLRLTTSSNVAGCWTGRSAGLAPLRIFPT